MTKRICIVFVFAQTLMAFFVSLLPVIYDLGIINIYQFRKLFFYIPIIFILMLPFGFFSLFQSIMIKLDMKYNIYWNKEYIKNLLEGDSWSLFFVWKEVKIEAKNKYSGGSDDR